MTPQFEIKKEILLLNKKWDESFEMPEDDAVEECYDSGMEDWEFQDSCEETRCSGEDSGLPSPSSRHYESTQVAKKMQSGRWVSWTYWHGGGKHSNPDEIEWIEGAFYVDCEEKAKTIIVRKFTRKGETT